MDLNVRCCRAVVFVQPRSGVGIGDMSRPRLAAGAIQG